MANTFVLRKEKNNIKLSLKFRQNRVIYSPGKPFEESDNTEVTNLIKHGVFSFELFNLDKHTGRLFKSCIIWEIKGKSENEKPYKKSRLII